MTDCCIVFITAPNEDEAAAIARDLVDSGLAACVNIVKEVRSIYRWRGKTEDEREVLMIAKSRTGLVDAVTARVKELHSYTVPEVVALPIIAGSDDYLSWLKAETGE